MTLVFDIKGQEKQTVSKTNMESQTRYGNVSHWANIEMPKVSYWDTMGFPAPTDAVVWEQAKKHAMSGKQILLTEVLNTIHSPGDILSGDIKFRRLKKLVDMEVSEKEGGFGKMKQHMSRSGCCQGRSPVTLLGEHSTIPYYYYSFKQYFPLEYLHFFLTLLSSVLNLSLLIRW